jgi:hypothetical protein
MFTDFDSVARHYANTKPLAGRLSHTRVENDIRPLQKRSDYNKRIVKLALTDGTAYTLRDGRTGYANAFDMDHSAMLWRLLEDGTFTITIYNARTFIDPSGRHAFLREYLPKGMRFVKDKHGDFIETNDGKFYLPRSGQLDFTGSIDSSSPSRSVAWRRSGAPVEYVTTRLDKALVAQFKQPIADFYDWFGITVHVLGAQSPDQIKAALHEFVPDAWYADLFMNIDKPLSMLIRDVIMDTHHEKRIPFVIMLAQRLGLYGVTPLRVFGPDNVFEGYRVSWSLNMPTTPKEVTAIKAKYRKIMYQAACLYAIEIH